MRTYIIWGQKGLVLKRRTQNGDHKNPGIWNTGAFKMNVNVKKNKNKYMPWGGLQRVNFNWLS